MGKETKVIVLHEGILQSWVRDASTLALVVSSIGVGVVLGSSAMQWLGAILAFFVIIGRAMGSAKRMTLPEAKAYLEGLEGSDGRHA